jgi:hypothetical protein
MGGVFFNQLSVILLLIALIIGLYAPDTAWNIYLRKIIYTMCVFVSHGNTIHKMVIGGC